MRCGGVLVADICLYVAWVLLAAAGFTVQLYMERNRPQFPERLRRRRRRTAPSADQLPAQRRRTIGGADDLQSERQPLLSAAASRYGMQQPSGDTWPGSVTELPPPPPYS